MAMRRDRRGFSMVELIVVIAILGILAGTSVTLFGHIRYANIKKAVETVSDRLDRQRIMSMSRQGTQYLYIYRMSDGYYMKSLSVKLDAYDAAYLATDADKICGKNIDISGEDSTGTVTPLASESSLIRIVFKKSGVLNVSTEDNSGTNVRGIVFSGSSTYCIRLIPETGKHLIE